MRCFVAAFLSAESAGLLQREAADWLDAARRRRLRPVPRENLHVTLKFLGETPAARLPDLLDRVAALGGCPVQALAVTLTGFPQPARARTLVAELAPQPQLASWWAELEGRLGRDGRDFRPHVTLARGRRPLTVASVGFAAPLPLTLAAPALYRSDPGPDGVRYRAVAGSDASA